MSSLRKQEAGKVNKEDNMRLSVHRQRACKIFFDESLSRFLVLVT